MIDAANLTPDQRRAEVEAGNAITYPWPGTMKSLRLHAQHTMGDSTQKYEVNLNPAADYLSNPDAVHTAYIIPV